VLAALAVWHTAVQYHAWHVLGLLTVGVTGFHFGGIWIRAAGGLILSAVLLFPGSLYALAPDAPRAIGAATPIGGAVFILGWIAFGIAVICARTPV
jgi:uncharacterized membrane protein YgdD (TMEM256/DUF423 family)